MRKFLFPKVLMILLTLMGFTWSAFAQGEAFNAGDRVINAGVGVGNYISYHNGSNKLFPIAASFEYGVANLFDGIGAIGIGGYAAYTSFNYNDLGRNVTIGDFLVGPRAMFHYQFLVKLDTYVGAMVGYDVRSFPKLNSSVPGSKFCYAYFLGVRYYVTNDFAFYGEVGYGVSPLQLGIAYKF